MSTGIVKCNPARLGLWNRVTTAVAGDKITVMAVRQISVECSLP